MKLETVKQEKIILGLIDNHRFLRAEMRKFEASEFNEESEIRQLQEAVNKAAGHLAHYVLRKTYGNTGSVPKTAIGDIKRAINSKKKQACGVIQPDKAVCMKHWAWLKNFEASIKQNGVPSWLA